MVPGGGIGSYYLLDSNKRYMGKLRRWSDKGDADPWAAVAYAGKERIDLGKFASRKAAREALEDASRGEVDTPAPVEASDADDGLPEDAPETARHLPDDLAEMDRRNMRRTGMDAETYYRTVGNAKALRELQAAKSSPRETPTHPGEEDLERVVAELDKDTAYRNAMANSDEQNARIEHGAALGRVMTGLLHEKPELYKQYAGDESFRGRLTEQTFDATYEKHTT